MSQEKVEYITIEKGENGKAIVRIGNAVKIVADDARIVAVDVLKLYKDNSIAAEIDTIKPADSVPDAITRVIENDITFEWVA